MINKFIPILTTLRAFYKDNQSLFAPLGFCIQATAFFLLTALFVTDFDLTGYSSAYLSKTILIYALVHLGAFSFLQAGNHITSTLEKYAPTTYWRLGSATTLFLPLMVLSGQKEMLFWATPLISAGLMILWMNRSYMYRYKFKRSKSINYTQLWQQLKLIWPMKPISPSNSTAQIIYDHVLISGAGTPLGQTLLKLLAGNQLKNLVLIDSDDQNLAFVRAWTDKFIPNTQVVFILSSDLTPKSLKSLLKSYQIKYVFDLDRCFINSQIEGARNSILHRNLQFPKLLLDQSIIGKINLVVSISAIPLDDDGALETAQSIVECYAQRLDCLKTRVIPFRLRALDASQEAIIVLAQQLFGQTLSDVRLTPVESAAKSILTILHQLQENPAHHGAVWEITHVREFRKNLQTCKITATDSPIDIKKKIESAQTSVKITTIASDFLFPTSQNGAAIVANCPLIETDFDQCFKDLEALLTASPEISSKKMQAG